MKAFELTVYPHAYPGQDDTLYRLSPTRPSVYGPAAVAMKQLSDGQLAAEVWHAVADRTMNASNVMMGDNYKNPYAQAAFQKSIDQAIVLHRFATLPHDQL